MTGISDQIIVFYVLGLILFIIGFETKRVPQTFIYLGISFLINIIGYFRSYSDSDFVTTAYIPLVLSMLSIVVMLYHAFEVLKVSFDDRYKDNENN